MLTGAIGEERGLTTTATMATSKLFQVPAGDKAVNVKLINPVSFGPSRLHRFMTPSIPGFEGHSTCPSFSFLLEHPSGRRLVWDLGIRKDFQNYSPKIAEYIPTTKYKIDAPKNVADTLEENGIPGKDVEAVIWRYVPVPNEEVLSLADIYFSVTGIGIILGIRLLSR